MDKLQEAAIASYAMGYAGVFNVHRSHAQKQSMPNIHICPKKCISHKKTLFTFESFAKIVHFHIRKHPTLAYKTCKWLKSFDIIQ